MCGEAVFMNVVTTWMTTSKQLQRMSPCASTLCHWHENSINPQKVCGAFEVTGKNIRQRTQWRDSVGTRAWMFKVHLLHEKEKTSKRLLCQIRNPTQVAALVVSHLDWNLPKEDKQAPLYKHANEVKGERVQKKGNEDKTKYKDSEGRLNQLNQRPEKAIQTQKIQTGAAFLFWEKLRH